MGRVDQQASLACWSFNPVRSRRKGVCVFITIIGTANVGIMDITVALLLVGRTFDSRDYAFLRLPGSLHDLNDLRQTTMGHNSYHSRRKSSQCRTCRSLHSIAFPLSSETFIQWGCLSGRLAHAFSRPISACLRIMIREDGFACRCRTVGADAVVYENPTQSWLLDTVS